MGQVRMIDENKNERFMIPCVQYSRLVRCVCLICMLKLNCMV